MFHWANLVAFHLFGETVKWSDLLGNLLGLATVALAVMALYGWFRWSSVRKNEHDITIRWARWSERALLVAGLGLGTVAFALVLKHYNASWAPWPDAYIFIGSLVATVAQAKGYVEFWFVWIAVDVVGVPLAFTNGLPVSGLVYVFYFAIVIAGLRQWVVKARAKQESIFSCTPLKEVAV
jgi:nicotinamide mononucleotide transporter